jgi:isopenicillin N synthase-like dioxygenase
MTQRAIPLVDLHRFTQGDEMERQAFVDDLGAAFHLTGFVGVINHGIPEELVDRFYTESKAFFALSEDVKKQYEIPGMAGQRGYTSFGKEHAKQSNVADLKEFFQIGQTPPEGQAAGGEYPPNVEVAERPDFLSTGMALYRAFESTGGQLLRAIATTSGTEAPSSAPSITPRSPWSRPAPSAPSSMRTSTSSPCSSARPPEACSF